MNEAGYSYIRSLKSDVSDEPINIHLIRPIAGLLVRILYNSPVTPNHLTISAVAVGLVAAFLYSLNTELTTFVGGLAIFFKDILDSADGQLARAKNLYSRAGRFLDSIGDFIVNLCVLTAIAYVIARTEGNAMAAVLGVLSFLCLSLRVSYHVFYHTAHLHTDSKYEQNRLIEEIRESDRAGDHIALRLQSIYLVLYGWQDRLMLRLDAWCRRGLQDQQERLWYGDFLGLRLAGFLGMGTELFLLTICSVANELLLYFSLNILLMNMLWVSSVLYRRFVLAPRLGKQGG